MPDPDRKTISASEAPALWNASPYVTRWMLWQKFANGVDIDNGEEHSRMSWGKKMQPLIAAQVAQDKKLEVIPNADDTYVRRRRLGCTRDATIICPDRGAGALEIKCVFDYKIWAEKWGNGEVVPREYEIQLQTQMYVGDGDERDWRWKYDWGLIAVWVCADLYYFERKPIHDLWKELDLKSCAFFDDIDEGREPDAFGAECEAPFIKSLFPDVTPAKELDFSADYDHVKTSEDVSMYQYHKDLVAGNCAPAERLRLKLLALARDAERVKLPCGVSYRIKKSGKGKTIIPYVPDRPLPPPPPKGETILAAG
jgi:hypothetical protein